jgi:rhodanese-related sulfurtransferase
MIKCDMFYRRNVLTVLCGAILTMATAVPLLAQQDATIASSNDIGKPATHPYCGLYCLYGVLKIYGVEVEFTELVSPRFISSSKGSSLAQLQQAAVDNGLYAEALTGLTRLSLHRTEQPLILLVKSNLQKRQYDHWILFLGMEGGKARIFDSLSGSNLVSLQQLMPLWGGVGLVVRPDPIHVSSLSALGRERLAIWALSAMALILIFRWGGQALLRHIALSKELAFFFSLLQASIFCFVAGLCGFVYHFADNTGFFSNTRAVDAIEDAYWFSFVPKLTVPEMAKLINTEVVIVDARRSHDYEAGHVRGAISLPVDANDSEYHDTMANIPKDAKIVLYCQRLDCAYSESVGRRLSADGYGNISVFKGGLVERNKDVFEDAL